MVAGADFGTGSSREHAVWALQNYGFSAVLSSRFADIFRGNSLKSGLLTVILPEGEIEAIWEQVEKNPATVISVDLEARQVRYEEKILPFEIDDYTRWRLMEGLDEIGLTLQHSAEVADFERKRATFKPVTLTN